GSPRPARGNSGGGLAPRALSERRTGGDRRGTIVAAGTSRSSSGDDLGNARADPRDSRDSRAQSSMISTKVGEAAVVSWPRDVRAPVVGSKRKPVTVPLS